MICPRCSRWNSEDEYRCTKCAARLSDHRPSSYFASNGALALQPSEETVAVAEAEADLPQRDLEPVRIPVHAAATQQSLFQARDARRVVSIGGESVVSTDRRSHRAPSHPKRRPAGNASYLPQQGILEFVPAAGPQPRRLATSVEARIFCDHPVASVTHRLIANLYDLAMMGCMVLLFLAMLYWGCDDLSSALSDPLAASVLCGATVLLGLIYECFFLAVRGETPGMRFAGLKLVDFDGRNVTESQMHMRILGCFASVLPIGCGLLWILVDEESLSWQDHISQTFLTPSSVD